MEIQIAKLLLDRAMNLWVKKNANDFAFNKKVKILSAKYDNAVGNININKITQLEKAYSINQIHNLPFVLVKQYKNTDYYEIIDGRHRVVLALKYKYDTLLCKLV
tara:strand:- start:2911 stop:3225 length:315 start_codon:yes stop_codon:yes gene_type:complete